MKSLLPVNSCPTIPFHSYNYILSYLIFSIPPLPLPFPSPLSPSHHHPLPLHYSLKSLILLSSPTVSFFFSCYTIPLHTGHYSWQHCSEYHRLHWLWYFHNLPTGYNPHFVNLKASYAWVYTYTLLVLLFARTNFSVCSGNANFAKISTCKN